MVRSGCNLPIHPLRLHFLAGLLMEPKSLTIRQSSGNRGRFFLRPRKEDPRKNCYRKMFTKWTLPGLGMEHSWLSVAYPLWTQRAPTYGWLILKLVRSLAFLVPRDCFHRAGLRTGTTWLRSQY